MSTGLNTWWATPVRPGAHFSIEELERSEQYHQPLRLVGAAAVAARLLLLVLGCWLVGWLDPADGLPTGDGTSADAGSLAGAGLFDVVGSGSLWLGAGLATVALRLPAIGADLWFEYRFSNRRSHQPGSESEFEPEPAAAVLPSPDWAPVPIGRFLATVTALAGLTWLALVIVGGAGYRLAAATNRWPVVAAILVVIGLVLATGVERPLRSRLPGSPKPLHSSDRLADSDGTVDADVPRQRLAELAAGFGLPGLEFQVIERQMGDPAAVRPPPADALATGGPLPTNAHAAGVGRNRRVVVTGALLTEPAPVRDFVVAHELSHVARRHVLMQTALSGAAVVLIIQGLAVLVRWGWPWRISGLQPLDPAAMPMTVLLLLVLAGVAAPVISWVARHQERVADSDAIAALGPLPPEEARRLLGYTRTDLSPPWWIRLHAHHPTPTERLEFMARHRR